MKTWSEWELVRHQVAIGGVAVDARGLPVPDARVLIASAPKQFERRIRGNSELSENRLRRAMASIGSATTRRDGSFYFLDLPAGKYDLECTDGKSGTKGERSVSVTWGLKGKIDLADVKIQLGSS
jgi:hypothetical protein